MSVDLKKHGRLRCQNGLIVDANGSEFLLKGIGLGGWLVPEGYMLHSSNTSPTTIYEGVVELIGESDAKAFFKEYYANYFNETDMKIISQLPINSVRLPFNYKMLSLKRGEYDERGFAIIEQVHSWCEKYGLYLILDMHCAPGSQNGENISDDLSRNPKLYTERETYEPWCIEIWQELVKRYKDSDVVAGFDLINEPVVIDQITNSELLESFERITKKIRETGDTHIVFIEGNRYSTQFVDMDRKFDDQQVFSFHKYWNPPNLESIKERAIDLREKTGCPLWMGESGENSNQWFYETIKLLEENKIGWNWWTHKKLETTTCPYSIKMTDGYRQIADYWRGVAPKPTAAFAKKALFEQVELFKIEKCHHLPDVEAALFEPVDLQISKPYGNNVAPVSLLAADYDIGPVGVTYYKEKTMRVDMRDFNGLNKGHYYRNDALSIFKIDGKPVLRLAAGEWTRYTIKGNGKFAIQIDLKGSGVFSYRIGKEEKEFAISTDDVILLDVCEIVIDHEVQIIIGVKEGSFFINNINVKGVVEV